MLVRAYTDIGNMSEDIDSNGNKNTTEYEKLKQEVRNKINVKAPEYVPKMYEALRKDQYEPDQAREQIERDFLNVWSKRWIRENLPKEAIREYDSTKRKLEQTSNIDAKKEIEVTTTGAQQIQDKINELPTRFIPLPTKQEIKPTTKKLRIECELDIGSQVIPLLARVYVDWEKQIVEIDSIEVNRQ